jgi:hypothetical protein
MIWEDFIGEQEQIKEQNCSLLSLRNYPDRARISGVSSVGSLEVYIITIQW